MWDLSTMLLGRHLIRQSKVKPFITQTNSGNLNFVFVDAVVVGFVVVFLVMDSGQQI